ncbi:MAG TPA: DUF222 domain-containing protein [Candidatus Dormibacteraeota bacterium]|nr:DUF222 domain-containing protein [Candidatus Dormibacteraeota bacterium]
MAESFGKPPMEPEMALLAGAVDRFCERHKEGRTPEQVTGELIHLRHQLDRLDLEFSEGAAAFAATDEYEAEGSVSPIHWVRLNCHMGGGAAADRIAVGEQLAHMPDSVEAMAAGDIGFAHLALIARTATAIAESGTNQAFDESALLVKAREFSVGRFREFCDHARHAGDPEGYARGEAHAVEARSLSFSAGQGGMVWVRGMLDPEGGAAVRTALEPLARPSGKGDHRKRDRRLADALVEAAHRLLDGGRLPRVGTQRPHLHVTTSLDTLLGLAGAPAANLEYSLPISARAVERIACDCAVTRILLGSDSAVIDVGRSRRVMTPAQRHALNVRDKGCRWPGCDRPATSTSGHHLVHWTKGGSTDLPNLLLLCYRHHWMAHEGGWQLVKTDDGGFITVPPPFGVYRHLARGPGTRTAA